MSFVSVDLGVWGASTTELSDGASRLTCWLLARLTVDPLARFTSPETFALSDALVRDWAKLQWFAEVSTAFGATATTLRLNYINQDGVSKTTESTPSLASFTRGRLISLDLAADDTGIMRVTDISIRDASNSGMINIVALKPILFNMRADIPNFAVLASFEKTGMPIIDPSACLGFYPTTDSVNSGILHNTVTLTYG